MPSASEEARLKAEAGAETEDEGTTWWVPVDDDDEWVLCTIEKKISGGKVTLGNRGALTPEVHLKRLHQPKLVNSKVILTEEAFAKSCTRAINTEVLSDLVMMSDINSASMLHTLRQRYDKDEIYTAIGGVLIAINPYKKLELCSTYTKVVDEDTPPHVSKTAATAYASLVDGDGAQSILISGESGAGKTETTKIAMACLTAISGSSGKTAEAALESGIVLETFGNAKTVFNNNSSRVVVLNEGTAVLTWRQKAQMLDLGAGGKGELHCLSIDCLALSLSRLPHTPRLPVTGELHCLSINSIADGEDKPVITVLAAHTPGEIEKWAAAVKAALKPPNTGTSKSTKELSEEKELKAKPLKQLKNLLAYMEVSVDPRRADDKDFLVQTVVDHRQALRSAKAFSKKMKKELAERMDKDRQKLLLRSVDELKALLVYLEAEFDESIDDKEKLVRLVVNQKNAVGMAKRHAKTLLRWRERSRGESAQAGELPAVRESDVMPVLVEDEAAGESA